MAPLLEARTVFISVEILTYIHACFHTQRLGNISPHFGLCGSRQTLSRSCPFPWGQNPSLEKDVVRVGVAGGACGRDEGWWALLSLRVACEGLGCRCRLG